MRFFRLKDADNDDNCRHNPLENNLRNYQSHPAGDTVRRHMTRFDRQDS